MDRIKFVNNSAPALNATNLNALQDNIENAIEDSSTALEETMQEMLDSSSSITAITDSSVRIWDLSVGVYQLPSSCVIYYSGSSGTSSFTVSTTSILFVTSYSTTYKNFFILAGNTSTTRYLYNGYSTSSTGTYSSFNLGSTYLTGISSYVKNNLTTSTSSTTYALSAYQGYVLNNKILDYETVEEW